MHTSSVQSHPRRLHRKEDPAPKSVDQRGRKTPTPRPDTPTDTDTTRALAIATALSPQERKELREYGLTNGAPQRLILLHASLAACGSTAELRSAVRDLTPQERCLPNIAPLTLLARMIDATEDLLASLTPVSHKKGFTRKLPLAFARFFIDGGRALTELEPVVDRNELRPFAWFLSAGASLLSRLPSSGSLARELREEVDLFLYRARVLHQFGILFIHGSETKQKADGRWEQTEIEQLIPVLETLPSWLLLGTPLLRSVVRHRESPYGWQACRANSGEIEIFDQSFWSTTHDDFLDGWRDAQVTFCHEVGHAFHFGDRYDLCLRDDGTILASGNPSAKVAEFADLSGWKVIRKHPVITRHGANVRILGLEVPLDTPHNVGADARIQLSHDPHAPRFSPLWVHNPDAGFTFGPNAHRSPWEDYADSFCTYFLAPKDLKRLAPAKFHHFEGVFHRFPTLTHPRYDNEPARISPQALREVLGMDRRRGEGTRGS